jgi:hypothetical protein
MKIKYGNKDGHLCTEQKELCEMSDFSEVCLHKIACRRLGRNDFFYYIANLIAIAF